VLSKTNADRLVSALVDIMEVLERAGIDIPGFESEEESEEEEEPESEPEKAATITVVGTPSATVTPVRSATTQFISDDPLLSFGGSVKALGDDGRVGGYLVLFTNENDLDLEKQFFNGATDYAIGQQGNSLCFFHHGLDPELGKRRLTDDPATLQMKDFGVWVEGQLALRDEYERWIFERIRQGKMGWSSGTAPNLVEIEQMANGSQWIKTWPLGLDASITPIPAEPRAVVMPLKSYLKFLETESAEGPQREGVTRELERERERTRLLTIL